MVCNNLGSDDVKDPNPGKEPAVPLHQTPGKGSGDHDKQAPDYQQRKHSINKLKEVGAQLTTVCIITPTHIVAMFIPAETFSHGSIAITANKVQLSLNTSLIILAVAQRAVKVIATWNL